ncbi:hypothetical protein [Mesorhizobium captivum]|uniref:hypothetical protein n=1 Tax=Mesorhizobium captivum TaxID=3072319 RepID=UPI002A247453|nr:hypothetical protein [Mesorhizobium sp. VK3C]MDX8445347.1 hypothetical protein [Mesorhizobium sp. VK3C]
MAGDDAGEWPSAELPVSWCWTDFATFFSDYTDSRRKVPQKAYRPNGRLVVVDQGAAKIGGYTDDLQMQSQVPLPAIVFGDHTRAVKYIEVPFAQGADGVRVLAVNNLVEPEFAYQALRCIELPDKGYSRHFKFLKASSFPLAPVPEQQRIVAKIARMNGKSRRARDHLDHIPRLVEKYKQAILAAAFRGGLIGLVTAETGHSHDRCWDLPTSWRWVRFSDVVEIASNLVKPEEIPELPHIAPDNIEGGTGRLLPFRTIREDKVISGKHRFFAGQVLYSKIRPYLRKAVLVDFDGACSADMYPLTVSRALDPAFLLYWLISEPFAGFTVEHEGRTVLPKINQQGLNQTPIPLPPLPDQMKLVKHLRSAFAWIDRLAAEAISARRLIDHLDQAVLARAFRGELVPQDPNDEPASVLLERIRVERGVAPKVRRGRAKVG